LLDGKPGAGCETAGGFSDGKIVVGGFLGCGLLLDVLETILFFQIRIIYGIFRNIYLYNEHKGSCFEIALTILRNKSYAVC
jgi:hypothetical protein